MGVPNLRMTVDIWYKPFVWLGVIGLLASLFLPFEMIAQRTPLALLFAGMFFFGVGEWKANKYRVERYPGSILTLPDRKPDLASRIMQGIGILLMILAVIFFLV